MTPLSSTLRTSLPRLVAAAGLSLGALSSAADAQLIRGSVRARASLLPIDQAMVAARDTTGVVLGSATSDGLGNYEFRVRAGVPFLLDVRRLGYAVGRASVKALAVEDTVDFEFLMTEVAAVTEAVTITAEPGLNDRRLLEANRRGWKVYEPEIIMYHRGKSQDFFQLMQSLGNPGLLFPRNINDCIRTTRTNRCLTYVVDNQVWGTTAQILPSDVYFVAILSASESRAQFGDRAPWGAIAVYTRSRLDRVQPPTLDRRPPSAGRPVDPARRPPE